MEDEVPNFRLVMPRRSKKKDLKKRQPAPQAKEAAPVKILECPPELGPAARQEWDRIVAELTVKGVLSSFDRGPLAAYCNAFALAMEAADMVQKHGAMIRSPNGFPMQSPYLSHLNQQVATMMRIGTEFGFTPASRTRIFSFDQKKSLLLDQKNSSEGFAITRDTAGHPWPEMSPLAGRLVRAPSGLAA